MPPIPAYGQPFDAAGQRDATAPRRWRLATITPRAVVVLAGIASFVVAIAIAPLVGTEFIPESDDSYIRMNVTLPVGTSLKRGSDKLLQVEDVVRKMPEIRMISTTIGDTGSGLRNSAILSIQLVKPHERKLNQREVEKAIRKALEPIPGIEVTLGNQPIFVSLLGPDPAVLEAEVLKLQERVSKVPGIADLTTSVQPGIPAYAVRLKRDAVRELGLTTMQLASSLRAYVNGDVATYWTSPDGEQVDVELRLPQTSRENIAQLNDLPVAYAKDGTPIALASVADIVPVVNPVVIKRQDLQRRQAIYAGTEGRPSGDVGADVQKIVKEWQLPPGYRFDVGGQTRDQQEAFVGVLFALGAAVIFIYIVLASQFSSFLQPLAIMASLPLALIGVMLALLVTRSTLNLFSMIGLVMLMGLVTKNAILLVDFANHGRRAGLSVPEALLQAGPGADAADHHDDGGDDLRHAAARARARRGRRDAGADGARDHRRRDHVDAADAGRRAGDLQLPGARQEEAGDAGGGERACRRSRAAARCRRECRRRRTEPRAIRRPYASDRRLARPPRLLRDLDDVANDRVDVLLPAAAAEDAVVADVRLHVVRSQPGPQPRQVLRCQGLADRADVVALAFDGEQRRAPDRRRVDLPAAQRQLAERQRVLLEDQAHGLEVEVGREIGDRHVLVVEVADRLRLGFLAGGEVREVLAERLGVALAVHADEGAQLQEARVDAAARALQSPRHAADQVLLEPGDRLARRQLVDRRRADPAVDRPGHQRQARRLRRVIVLGHDRGRGERGDAGLADRDDVRAGAERGR